MGTEEVQKSEGDTGHLEDGWGHRKSRGVMGTQRGLRHVNSHVHTDL